ncbi:MAG: sucrose synthase [Timaviella obliquedivisa GSE-PSE-MK23-08B]|jgi:sucrose synthase|nr:sucrose synthase [Timaviella obliquedivisa GSE-PSE-MK23-08B]
MHDLIQNVLSREEQVDLLQLIDVLRDSGKRYFLRNEILQTFSDYCHQAQKPTYFYHTSVLGKLLHFVHELILAEKNIWVLVRPWVASQEIWSLNNDLTQLEQRTPQALLKMRDSLVKTSREAEGDRSLESEPRILEIDMHPFYEKAPTIHDPRTIGQGLEVLNRHLCNQVLSDPQYWLNALFQVLKQHQYDNISLMINDKIHSSEQLIERVKQALEVLSDRPANQPCEAFRKPLQELGFEPGWGNNTARVQESLELLNHLVLNPEPAILEAFMARIPAVFRVVLVSIHGWVAQEGTRKRPEVTGQVVYVLEQAASLEHYLWEEIELAGLGGLGIQPDVVILTRLIPNCDGTHCNMPLEKIHGTQNAWILRVPFHVEDAHNPLIQHWIPKSEIWPYLETFAVDAEKELLAHFHDRPGLIIGNYSDGNLVASLLARRLNVTHCTIAHTLEKPRYLFSDMYWQEMEAEHHFSSQFTADLISMNAADFIITSSYQEIVGTPDTLGQYESYKCFSLPHLYHVIDGINLFSPKFNRVPPGVNEQLFFPYSRTGDRIPAVRARVHDLLFTQEDPHIVGHFNDLSKTPILAIAPLVSAKNFKGLVECFGRSQPLRSQCNLILITHTLDASQANSVEEAEAIVQLHQIIQQYGLDGSVRWIGTSLPGVDLGEIYRIIADYRGIFVHFTHFAAFGRTVLEAMSSGLPTFVSEFGGSLEILGDAHDHFHLNPTDLEGTSKRILDFFDQCNLDPHYWQDNSDWAVQQIQNHYNWQLHTRHLLLLAKMYSFWNFVFQDDRQELLHYLDTLFHLVYKPRAETILKQL